MAWPACYRVLSLGIRCGDPITRVSTNTNRTIGITAQGYSRCTFVVPSAASFRSMQDLAHPVARLPRTDHRYP